MGAVFLCTAALAGGALSFFAGLKFGFLIALLLTPIGGSLCGAIAAIYLCAAPIEDDGSHGKTWTALPLPKLH